MLVGLLTLFLDHAAPPAAAVPRKRVLPTHPPPSPPPINRLQKAAERLRVGCHCGRVIARSFVRRTKRWLLSSVGFQAELGNAKRFVTSHCVTMEHKPEAARAHCMGLHVSCFDLVSKRPTLVTYGRH